jgi:glycosyltransferase involved in cell wall biosynthesis
MTHGTLWFLKEVFPKVLGSVPDLSVDVVGRNANQIQQYIDLPRAVRVVADVPSVTPYLSEAWCNVCPLFFESGTRFKILEASERAVPTVSTALGAEGLDFKHGHDILIADDSIDFADSIVKLLTHQNIRELIGERSRETVVQRYSIGAGYSAARTVLEQLSS